MRIFELLFTIILFLSIIMNFIIGNKISLLKNHRYIQYLFPGSAVLLAIVGIWLEGFRFVMSPLYFLSLIIFIIVLVKHLRLHREESSSDNEDRVPLTKEPKNNQIQRFQK